MRLIALAIAALCLSCAAQDVALHIDSVILNYATTGPSNNVALTKVNITVTGLTPGDSFVPLKSSDFTNWVSDIGRLTVTNSTYHYESYNAADIFPGPVFYRVMVIKQHGPQD